MITGYLPLMYMNFRLTQKVYTFFFHIVNMLKEPSVNSHYPSYGRFLPLLWCTGWLSSSDAKHALKKKLWTIQHPQVSTAPMIPRYYSSALNSYQMNLLHQPTRLPLHLHGGVGRHLFLCPPGFRTSLGPLYFLQASHDTGSRHQ